MNILNQNAKIVSQFLYFLLQWIKSNFELCPCSRFVPPRDPAVRVGAEQLGAGGAAGDVRAEAGAPTKLLGAGGIEARPWTHRRLPAFGVARIAAAGRRDAARLHQCLRSIRRRRRHPPRLPQGAHLGHQAPQQRLLLVRPAGCRLHLRSVPISIFFGALWVSNISCCDIHIIWSFFLAEDLVRNLLVFSRDGILRLFLGKKVIFLWTLLEVLNG